MILQAVAVNYDPSSLAGIPPGDFARRWELLIDERYGGEYTFEARAQGLGTRIHVELIPEYANREDARSIEDECIEQIRQLGEEAFRQLCHGTPAPI